MVPSMKRAARFVVPLVLGLAALTAIAHALVLRTTRRWFETDMRLRSEVVVSAAREGLVHHWSADERPALEAVLQDIAVDDRVMGVAACRADGTRLAATQGYPADFSCRSLLSRREGTGAVGSWSQVVDLPGGRVQVTIVPVDGVSPPGVLALVHDLSFAERRETTTRALLFGAFFVLALGGSLLTLLVARVAYRGWTAEFRRALKGDPPREMLPLVRDVRDLVQQLASERVREVRGGAWSAKRLKQALAEHLQGERILVVANREPWIHERDESAGEGRGGIRVVHPASGLVTALEPVMRACGGTWVAHGSGTADRDVVDAHGRVRVPPGEESYQIRRVWLTEAEEVGYYYGFANEGLWPLCHVADTRPVFRAEDWEEYRRVNQKFADAVCEEAGVDDPIVLVQDYHFALAPKMIRERLPKATILTFWHIPWSSAERFGICPYRNEILEGLLGSSIVGFHTQQHCNHFLDAIDAFLEARIDREDSGAIHRARKTRVRPYPISIEWPVHWLDDLPSVAECRAKVLAELGLPDDTLLGVGVDRLDYTKGIEERLLAVDEALAQNPDLRGRFRFVQLAAPSRTRLPKYKDLNDRVEATARAINEKWGTPGYEPVVLRRAHHEPATVYTYFRAANVCYVSSLHDGMNLVAKEFVAARDDEQGVLVLSQFTGAARELTEALVVNPYDVRQAGAALVAGLGMEPSEQRERMAAMRRLVSELNVYRWAGRMLADAADLRRQERLAGRLTTVSVPASVPNGAGPVSVGSHVGVASSRAESVGSPAGSPSSKAARASSPAGSATP